jgi:hypothetical protein
MNHVGKLFTLAIYLIFALFVPIFGYVPAVHDHLKQSSKSIILKEIDLDFRPFIQELKSGNEQQMFLLLSPELKEQTATSTWDELSSRLASTTNDVQNIFSLYIKLLDREHTTRQHMN